jgi:hypothetical protein
VWVYSGREERQEWAVPGQGGGGGGGGGGDADDGGSLWLPGGCVASFRMVPDPEAAAGAPAGAAAAAAAAASSNGNGAGGPAAPRGVILSFSWLLGEGTCLGVEREYAASGRLWEVRATSSVRGGWSGGRM